MIKPDDFRGWGSVSWDGPGDVVADLKLAVEMLKREEARPPQELHSSKCSIWKTGKCRCTTAPISQYADADYFARVKP